MTQINTIHSFLNYKDEKKITKNADNILQAYTNIKIDEKHLKKLNKLNENVSGQKKANSMLDLILKYQSKNKRKKGNDEDTIGISTNITKKTSRTNKINRNSAIQCPYHNKSRSHSNQNKYTTPNRTRYQKIQNQEQQNSKIQKINKKQKKNNKNKNFSQSTKKKVNKQVIDFSSLMEKNKSKSTNKMIVIQDALQKQYSSNHHMKSISNKKIHQFCPVYDVNFTSNNIHNVKRNQSQRMEKLKNYLLSDTERITKIKRQSDEHVIEQFNLTQKTFCKNLQQLKMQKQQMNIQAQKLLKDTKNRYEQQLQLNNRQIQHLKGQLTQQKASHKKTQVKLKQSQLKMTNIKQQFQNKSIQSQHLSKIVQKLRSQRDHFQMLLKKCQKQKQIIKEQVQQVLGVVRQEIYNNMSTI